MSDPTPRVPPAPPPHPDDAAQARRRSPLPWILLLLVIALAAWYFISRSDMPAEAPPPIGETTPLPSESPVSTPSAPRERPASERVQPSTTPADRVATAIDQPQPEYPAAALRAGEQGTVMLRVDVGADGKPTDVQVVERSRSRDLDRAAQRAVRDWTFQPAMRNGKAVASVVQVPVDFNIDTQ